MRKGIFLIFLIFLIILSGCNITHKPDGRGTKRLPYKIKTVENLKYINNELSAHYILMNNIDLAEIEWDPIGGVKEMSSYKPFTGYFDGNGYSIKNLTITKSENSSVGLFAHNSGTIINLGLENTYISFDEYSKKYIGTIAGYNDGVINASYSSGDLNGGGRKIGGLVGSNRGEINNSYSLVNIESKDDIIYAGGISGQNSGLIKASYSIGTIKIKGYACGITSLGSIGVIENSFSTSNIYADISGGTVDHRYSGRLINTYGFKGQIIGYTMEKHSNNSIGLEELHSKQWYQEVMKWDESVWDLSVVSDGFYPKHINSQAQLITMPTTYQLGSEGNTIKIYTAEDLINIKNTLSLNGIYELMNDIDLSDIDWVPLGTVETPFRGDINGNGYTISNISINGDYKYAGLFGYYIGKMYDIHCNNVNIVVTSSDPSYAGGIIGYSSRFKPWKSSVDNLNIEFTNSEETYQGILAGNESELDI